MVDIIKQDMTDLWASSGDIVAPVSAKVQQGWVVEVVPRQWWNWFENRQDTNIAYMLQKGIPEWDMVTEYLANKSYIQYFGIVYKSILTGTNKVPTSEPTYWVKAFPNSTAASEALSAVTPAVDTIPYFTNGTTASTTGLTAFARTILDDVDASAVRTTISAQTLDATLTAIAGVVTSTNALIYFNGIDTATSTTLTAFGRSLIDDIDAAAGRTTLGLSNSATIAATSANTASTIVQRDASGNFVAGTVTAALTGNASTATVLQTARTINGVSFDGSVNITVADSTKLPLTGGTLTGDLTFSGARKILGTFSGGTSDTVFQTSTVNDGTRVGAIPNGTSSLSQFHAFNNSNLTDASFVAIQANAVSSQVISGRNGLGTYLPLELLTSGIARLTINTSGGVSIPGGLTAGTVTSGKVGATGTGNDYNLGGVELVGDGAANTVFPTLGFHQPSLYAGSIQLRGADDFRFYAQGAASFANITANSFIGSGASLTALNAGNIATGTLAVARGGTGVTTSTGTGSVVLSASPALSGAPTAPTAAINTNTTQLATTAFVERYKPGAATPFTFVNSWTDSNAARYNQSAGSGEVILSGIISHAYPVVTNQAITAALPVALRPAVPKHFICYITSSAGLFFGSCIVQVQTDGVVKFIAVTSGGDPAEGSGNYLVHLDPIRYNP